MDVVIAPSTLHIHQALDSIQSHIQVASQNISTSNCGAFTGELAASQVRDFGLNWTLTGHSERRTLYHESNSDVALKTKMALEQGLSVIVCIGETLTEREAEQTLDVVTRQLAAIIPGKLSP